MLLLAAESRAVELQQAQLLSLSPLAANVLHRCRPSESPKRLSRNSMPYSRCCLTLFLQALPSLSSRAMWNSKTRSRSSLMKRGGG